MNKIVDSLGSTAGCILLIAYFGWGIMGIAAGFAFLEDALGWNGCFSIPVMVLLLRIFPPGLTLLAFLGAYNVFVLIW